MYVMLAMVDSTALIMQASALLYVTAVGDPMQQIVHLVYPQQLVMKMDSVYVTRAGKVMIAHCTREPVMLSVPLPEKNLTVKRDQNSVHAVSKMLTEAMTTHAFVTKTGPELTVLYTPAPVTHAVALATGHTTPTVMPVTRIIPYNQEMSAYVKMTGEVKTVASGREIAILTV